MDDCPRCAEIKREKAMEDETTLVEVEMSGTVLLRVRNYDGDENGPRWDAGELLDEAKVEFRNLPDWIESVEIDEWVALGDVRVVSER
jgi:hypothetical protein